MKKILAWLVLLVIAAAVITASIMVVEVREVLFILAAVIGSGFGMYGLIWLIAWALATIAGRSEDDAGT